MNLSNPAISAQEFFKHWVDVCKPRHDKLYENLGNSRFFTAQVLTGTNSIIESIAEKLGLKSFCGYGWTDAVLFKDPEDRVPNVPAGTTWIRRIRVAFEHENFFNSGLFTEVSHLMITDCDLRVLVSYPNSDSELEEQLTYLHQLIKGSDRSSQISENGSFLFIVDMGNKCFDWWGFVYKNDAWQKII